MRVLISVAASLMLVLALVGPVAATGPGCSDFGAASAAGGHKEIPGSEGVPFGQFLSEYVHLGPGTISGIVASEHSTMCTHP